METMWEKGRRSAVTSTIEQHKFPCFALREEAKEARSVAASTMIHYDTYGLSHNVTENHHPFDFVPRMGEKGGERGAHYEQRTQFYRSTPINNFLWLVKRDDQV
jgi:hypothetical protein